MKKKKSKKTRLKLIEVYTIPPFNVASWIHGSYTNNTKERVIIKIYHEK